MKPPIDNHQAHLYHATLLLERCIARPWSDWADALSALILKDIQDELINNRIQNIIGDKQ